MTRVHKHETFRYITHLHRRARLNRQAPWNPLNTLDLRKKLLKKTDEWTEKYLQILNIQYIQTRGLPGCRHCDGNRVLKKGDIQREPSCPKHRTCSGVFPGSGDEGGLTGQNAYRQQCRTSLKATVIHLEYSHLVFSPCREKIVEIMRE